MLTESAPIYSAELAPPDLRGLMVGMNGVNIALGYGLASYMVSNKRRDLVHYHIQLILTRSIGVGFLLHSVWRNSMEGTSRNCPDLAVYDDPGLLHHS